MAFALVDYSSEDDATRRPEVWDSSDDEDQTAENGGEIDDRREENGGGHEEEDLERGANAAPDSSLLSPDEAFAEITGPPEFLKHAITHEIRQQQQQQQKKVVEAVVEAKPQLAPRSSTDSVATNGASATLPEAAAAEATPRVIQAQDPSPQDAADLLRMCLQCGVPKTSSEGRMVCPVCRDNPRKEVEQTEKKRVPKVKDKERSKRMKGQSSHATWKSETEMHLRQQFD